MPCWGATVSQPFGVSETFSSRKKSLEDDLKGLVPMIPVLKHIVYIEVVNMGRESGQLF